VSGLFAANELFNKPLLSLEELLEYAATWEGHPDNVAPALYGGVRLSIKERNGFKHFPLSYHRELTAVVCIPAFELATAKAREVLPNDILREAAVENISRSMLLSSAIAKGRWADLSWAMKDRLHQPYRAPLINGFTDVMAAALAAGTCGAALSGSGPTILALCRKGPEARSIGAAMCAAFQRHGIESRFLILGIENRGARTIP
jgi:homoserine kinase